MAKRPTKNKSVRTLLLKHKIISYIKRHDNVFLLFAFFFVYFFVIVIKHTFIGNIAFWFDPARDFLLAWSNLQKPTLIGQPSGIPGVFYGPYWVWLISSVLLFTKDPRIVLFIILTIPYFTLFPYILFKFSHIVGKKIILLLWLLFMLGYSVYSMQLWNIYPAPLLFLLLTYLMVFIQRVKRELRGTLLTTLAGITIGLILNFHLSFGIGIFFATTIFLILESVYAIYSHKTERKRVIVTAIIILFSFFLGVSVVFLPTLVFEARHGFQQKEAVLKTITDALLYNSAAVGQVGLNKQLILRMFFEKLGEVLKIPGIISYVVYGGVFVWLLRAFKKKRMYLDEKERKLLLYLFLCFFGLVFLYTSSKNPIWSYHFTGIEIIVLLLLGLVIKHIMLFYRLLLIWTVVLIIGNIVQNVKSFNANPYILSSLATKERIANIIYQDASNQPFIFYAYSSAIYTYDYDYIFMWLGERYNFTPVKDVEKAEFVYLIIPKVGKSVQEDFINYKTPRSRFKTIKTWESDDGTTFIKRVKL